jgi:hypothetical protein
MFMLGNTQFQMLGQRSIHYIISHNATLSLTGIKAIV